MVVLFFWFEEVLFWSWYIQAQRDEDSRYLVRFHIGLDRGVLIHSFASLRLITRQGYMNHPCFFFLSVLIVDNTLNLLRDTNMNHIAHTYEDRTHEIIETGCMKS